jgi:predicted PurR-regulated permease PerM
MEVVVFILIVLFGVIGRVLQSMAAARAFQQQIQQIQQFQMFGQAYNAAVEQQFRMLMASLQAHQPDVTVQHRRVVQQIQSLPAQERGGYKQRLDEVMSGFELNPRTGEWEERRR